MSSMIRSGDDADGTDARSGDLSGVVPPPPPPENTDVVVAGSAYDNADDECIICLHRRPGARLLPCGHSHFCNECAMELRKCPLCRAPMKSIVLIDGTETPVRPLPAPVSRADRGLVGGGHMQPEGWDPQAYDVRRENDVLSDAERRCV